MSSKPTLDLLYVCQELCRRSILTEVYDGGVLSLAFAQAEFRELTYSRIPALSRRILHLNIAQALADLSPASVPDLDALTAYHYDQGGDQFHAMQYKVHRFKTYVVFNYALLNGMPREGEVLLNSTPQALDQFHRMERELQELQRLHPGDQALKKVEWDLYYSVGCFCIYRGLYQEGLDAIRRILDDPAAPVELLDLAHEQMTFYGIQTYQTQVMREHIQIALALTQGRDPARYAVNRRYNGYLLVMENRYEEGREELLRSLMLLRDGVTDDVELRLQSAYAHDYIGEAYRKQGSYEKAIGEYQMAIQTIGTFPTSTSKPMFYVNWAQAALPGRLRRRPPGSGPGGPGHRIFKGALRLFSDPLLRLQRPVRLCRRGRPGLRVLSHPVPAAHRPAHRPLRHGHPLSGQGPAAPPV